MYEYDEDKDWTSEFEPMILDRGFDYYMQGRVGKIEKEEDGYSATIMGSFKYDVYVELNEYGELLHADCTCPYAEEGNYCKHMAALLFALESRKDFIEDDDIEIEKIVSKFSRKDLEHLVVEYSSRAPKFKEYIKNSYYLFK